MIFFMRKKLFYTLTTFLVNCSSTGQSGKVFRFDLRAAFSSFFLENSFLINSPDLFESTEFDLRRCIRLVSLVEPGVLVGIFSPLSLSSFLSRNEYERSSGRTRSRASLLGGGTSRRSLVINSSNYIPQ